MAEPTTIQTAIEIASIAFIKSGAGELAKKFTGHAISKIGQLQELIWNRVVGKHPTAATALEQAKSGKQEGIDRVAKLLDVEMLDEDFAGQVQVIAKEINAGEILDQSSMIQNIESGGTGYQNQNDNSEVYQGTTTVNKYYSKP
jgi:hypothetical protein